MIWNKNSVKSWYAQSPKLTNRRNPQLCSSRTDKNELCVLGECILHPTCCIVIKVPPVLYYCYTTLYLASMSFIRSTVFAFWSQILYRRRAPPPPSPRRAAAAAQRSRRLSLAAMPCARLYYTKMRPHFDRANAACHSAAAIAWTTDTQWMHKTKNERNLKIWAHVADKICFVRT